VHQLEIKVLNIIDARCNHAVYKGTLGLCIKLSMVMPWLRDLIAALSQLRHGFKSRRLHFVYVANKMALGQVFLLILRVFPVITITPALHTHYSCTSVIEKPLNNTLKIYLRLQ